MKTDRLYAITLYLLNHGRTSASELAKHFEVSVRTIQRDMDSLCQAGIPLVALTGSSGGYEIAETFQMNNQLVSKEDFAYIATALHGLRTVTRSKYAEEVLEKISAISKQNDTGMILDFSVLREGDENLLQRLQSAVGNRQVLKILYTNNSGETREHHVEPIAVMYKWYAWYLLAYSKDKKDYRTYKLVRMDEVRVTGESFQKEHPSTEDILAECDNTMKNNTPPTKVKLSCTKRVIHRIKEYMNGKIIETKADGSTVMEIYVVEQEQWWIGNLLSLGASVKVLEPEHIRKRIVDSAKELLFLYGEL